MKMSATSSTFQTIKIDGLVDLLSIHQENSQRYPFLLESVASDGKNNRYDILFAYPQQNIQLVKLGKVESDINDISSTHFLVALDEWFKKMFVQDETQSSLPFRGGWFLYLGYELAQEIEPVLSLPLLKKSTLPVAYACRIPAALIVDREKKETWCLTENTHAHHLDDLYQDVITSFSHEKPEKKSLSFQLTEEAPDIYLCAIKRIKQYILDGDIFQVNLSRLWKIHLQEKISSENLYMRLRQSNPAPFSALCHINQSTIISSSPERLFSVKDSQVDTRPIAGTCPRLRDKNGHIDLAADQQLQEALLAHPKERAEHVMLIDLERNDLGRIARPGTVEVNELMVLESYEHVHHIVSNVRGKLKPNVSPGDIIAATFPGGTITGCPKVRCMEIIAELEGNAREAYTGALGYLNRNGDMDLNILIRTIVRTGNELHIRAGGGIVSDSDGNNELLETEAKVKGMLNAVK